MASQKTNKSVKELYFRSSERIEILSVYTSSFLKYPYWEGSRIYEMLLWN